jgi:hypothetical protein
MLLGGSPGLLLGQQDSTEKSGAPAQPGSQASPQTPQPQTPPAKAEPQPQTPSEPNQSETPSTEQAEPPAQSDTSGKSQEPPPEEKKTTPCTTQDKSKCGARASKQSRRVVHHGSTGEPTAQLAPGMTPQQALHHRQTTEQLLGATDGNLEQLARRNLNQNQQDTVSQIRNYMAGARSALQDGDLSRARTLAFKAHLLANDLLKH